MPRKTQILVHPRGSHELQRMARPRHVVDWIKNHVEEDGGSATFVGFGPTAVRLFGKAQGLLPGEYHTQLIVRTSISARAGQTTWREQRDEYRLIVTHRDAPWTPQPRQAQLLPQLVAYTDRATTQSPPDKGTAADGPDTPG
jgi:hypothetical protein